MDLSNDLISKFVKITNDADKQKSKEGTVYGTAVKYNGGIYVKIDGSDLLTPIDTTADIKEGERVTITIKDHNATVTGNITSPSASRDDVKKVTKNVEEIEGEITEFEAVIADVVHVGELDAEVARIDELLAGKVTIEDLTATNAEITNLKAKDAEIENLVADKATIEDLTATNAEITNLKAKDAEIENLVADKATIEDLTATNAEITNLKANKADIEYLDANFATIDQLEATHANIDVLDAEVANINTLVNGNLTSDNILSFNITSKNTTMEDAFIKDAMIDRITANKIMSGTIDTNNVVIQSTDGSMLLQGNILQMKDESGKVRIQIGKDTGGNFTFVLYDESGKGVLIDEEGIKSSDAIADGLIVDAKVADNANISGSKLDIASVITEVNKDNSTTIKSSKIYLDEQNQSLEVAFNSLKSQVETIQDVTINGDLSSIVEQVQSNTTKIEANKEGINTLVAENVIRTEEISDLEGELQQVNTTLSNKYASLEQNLDGFKTTVSDTYTTKTEFNNLEVGGRNYLTEAKRLGIKILVAGTGSEPVIETNHAECPNGYHLVGAKNVDTRLRIPNVITSNGIWTVSFELKGHQSATVGFTMDICDLRPIQFRTTTDNQWVKHSSTVNVTNYNADLHNFIDLQDISWAHVYIRNIKVEKGDKATDWTPAPEDVQANIDAVDGKFANYSTTTQMNSAINQKANEITSSVSSTYTTKTEFSNLAIGGRNLIKQSDVVVRSDTSTSYDKNTATWTITANAGAGDSWGAGLMLRGNSIRIPYGKTYVLSFEIKVPRACSWNIDVNNYAVTGSSWNGNDNDDNLYTRATSSKSLVANQWIKCWSRISNTNSKNTDKVDIYDNSNFGVVMLNETSSMTYQIRNIQGEIGNIPSEYTPAPEDVQSQIDTINTNLSTSYATKSELTQTNNSIVAKFSESGGYNLIRNSTGAGGNTNGWTHTGTSMGVEPNDGIGSASRYYLYLDNGTTTTERYAYSSRFKLKPNTTYRFTGYFHNYTKCTSFEVFVLSSTSLADTDTTTGYTNVHQLITATTTNNSWKKFTTTFTTPASTKSGILRIDNNGYNQSGTNSNRVHWNCLILTEGEMEVPWSPHPSEVYDGITKIDKDGIKVTQSNYNGYTQMKADGFYVNNGSENVISITKDGSYFKGKVVVTSGSTVPTSVLSGTISSSQLNSTITSDISTAKTNASTAVSTANTAKSTADTASTNASNAVSTANTANTNASNAVSTANTAKSTADTASTNASNAVKTANTASTNASNAVSTANTANTNASNAVSTANTASTNASNAVKTANTASTNASTAVSTANTAKSTADTAKSTADSVKSTVDSGKTNWNNAYNRVNEWAYGAVTGSTTIDGGYIQANTITVNKIAVGDFNNYCDLRYGFSSGVSWAPLNWNSNGYWNNDSTKQYIQLNQENTTRAFNDNDSINFTFDFWIDKSITLGMGLWYYDSSKTYLGANYASQAVTTLSTWHTISKNVTVGGLPTGTKYVRVLLNLGGTGYSVAIRNIKVFRRNGGELIVDGAITAAKIASRTITADRIVSGAITANEIAANAITAAKIAAGAITADKLAANAITSKTITGSTITGGTINGATITSETLMKTYGGMYVGSEIWGGFKKDSSGNYSSAQTFLIHGSTALQIDGNPTRISSVTGEVKIGDASSYDNLRAKCLYAQEIVYTDDIRSRTTGNALLMENISMRAANAYVQFTSGLGVVRVKERNHLYLQTGGNTGGDTSAEIRCTRYTDASNYVNIRAHNVCAQNAVYAAGVNVSSDRSRKRDIELYSTDALQEVCSTPVYAYHLDTDKDEELKRIGIIMQEAPLDAIDLTGKGVDLYQMVTMLWKATQQQQEMIEDLKRQLKGE